MTTNRKATTTNRKAAAAEKPATAAPLPIYEPATCRLNLPATGYGTLEAYRDAIRSAYEAGYQALDAAAAYAAIERMNDAVWRAEHAAAMTALYNLTVAATCVLRTLQNCNYRTGTSCLYNVLDGRMVHGVHVGRKTAQRLGGSRAFARFCEQFVAVRTGNGTVRRTSCNGVAFTVDKRQFVTA